MTGIGIKTLEVHRAASIATEAARRYGIVNHLYRCTGLSKLRLLIRRGANR